MAIAGGAFGLLLGVIGIVVAKKSQRQGTGLPIAGTVVNALAILIGGAWLLVMALVFNKGGGDSTTDPGPGIAITSLALDQEYDDNELAADKKYKGKALIVTGAIKKITRDDKPGKVTIELTGTAGSTVDCHFDRDKQAELGGLALGQEVTIRGTCKGKVRTFVTLETCSLDQKPPEEKKPEGKGQDIPPLAVTAEELERAYDGNVVAADTMYKGKALELTGKVVRVARNKPGKVTVEFESEVGPPVDCDFTTKEAQAPLGGVAVGDMVVVRGTCRGKPDDDVVTLTNCTLVKKLDKPAEGPPVIVTAEVLAKAYEGNVVAADAKYKGKFLEVTGKVLRVGKRPPGKIAVEIGTEERLMLVCDFLAKEGQAQLAAVEVGDTVVIRGTCKGGGDGLPLLENCTLVKK